VSGRFPRGVLAAAIAASALASCGDAKEPAASTDPALAPRAGGSIEVRSRDFAPGAPIPKRFARPPEGAGGPPDLSWGALPEGTKEVVLLVEDPDAPTPQPFVHWFVYGMDPGGAPFAGAKIGKNDFGEDGWGGPDPPKGSGVHHYRFRVLALDAPTTAPAGSTFAKVLPSLKGHVLAEGRLVGTYEKR
jgi:Raf kinase inhibitor-like YbhB/YbcL family protein